MESNGKKVLVTGASGGIGRAIAVAAARAGYEVLLHYTPGKEKIDALIKEINEFGGTADSIQFDISDREDCQKILEIGQ